MRKKVSLVSFLTAIALILGLVVSPVGSVFANIADGTYQVNYEIKEASSNNASIADGYFTSPATVTVQNGVKTVQLTLTGSSMIESLSASGTPVTVVSDSGDTRVVKFNVSGDLSQPINLNMHIIVPDSKEMPGGYDMKHGARAVFDVSGLPAPGAEQATSTSDNTDKEPVANPPTGDSTPVALYVTLLLASVGIFTIYKLRFARN